MIPIQKDTESNISLTDDTVHSGIFIEKFVAINFDLNEAEINNWFNANGLVMDAQVTRLLLNLKRWKFNDTDIDVVCVEFD